MAGRYLTVRQLAERIGVSSSVIRRHDAALRPLRLHGRDRRYTEAHVVQARRLLLGTPGEPSAAQAAQAGTGPLATADPALAAQAWQDDPAMAWLAADLAGEPLPPDAAIVPTYEREHAEADRRAEEALPTLVRVSVSPAVWQELEAELAAELAAEQTP